MQHAHLTTPHGASGTGASSFIALRSMMICSRLYRITSRYLAAWSSSPGSEACRIDYDIHKEELIRNVKQSRRVSNREPARQHGQLLLCPSLVLRLQMLSVGVRNLETGHLEVCVLSVSERNVRTGDKPSRRQSFQQRRACRTARSHRATIRRDPGMHANIRVESI